MLAKWLQNALELAGLSQAELARQLTSALGKSIDRGAVNKMMSGQRAISATELLAIEKVTGIAAPSEIHVPLVGRVGAGQVVEALADNDLDRAVPAPSQVKSTTVAVEISGDSMYPAYEEGTLLYYSKILPPAEMINRRAVVQLADGRIFVKILRPGSTPSTWTLQSLNARFADMTDELVEWAAPIDWTRPRP